MAYLPMPALAPVMTMTYPDRSLSTLHMAPLKYSLAITASPKTMAAAMNPSIETTKF